MDKASFLEALFLTASFLFQGKQATPPRLSSSQLQTPRVTASGCLLLPKSVGVAGGLGTIG